MPGKIRHYFASGNTAKGFHSLYASSLDPLQRLYILKGGPGTGKSTLMKKLGETWSKKGFDVEYIHCSSDHESIDGILLPQLQAGVADGTAPHIIEPRVPGAIEEYINLGAGWNSSELRKHKKELLALRENIQSSYQSAYHEFSQALRIHDDWEKIFIENMNFKKANLLTQKLLSEFFQEENLNKKAKVIHRFLGAATSRGAVDYVPNLTEDVQRRIFIKGRPGSGKSTMLKKIAAEAEKRGYDTEVYHCGFDPDSLDMVILREAGIAIFDSTAPHEYFPEREGDEILDMYALAILPGTDEKFAVQLKEISSRYAERMKQGTFYLAEAKALHDQVEAIYTSSMNFLSVNEAAEEISSEFERLAAEQIIY
ncbi:hypothetical protein GJU40_03200 [Bacillus lacus]|uniref:ATPase n=1 Tax=Metabacillus lacus TaxID=1983721 RepID=A0A7X2IWM3_9BACI|nr:PRK06851 family protein [Metabacillus lacus]MRX71178.1 hypothetical protein [Metabacillus lacus]